METADKLIKLLTKAFERSKSGQKLVPDMIIGGNSEGGGLVNALLFKLIKDDGVSGKTLTPVTQ